jgi:ABC-type nitrate/sulfonate/bicarbonate transport system permease component
VWATSVSSAANQFDTGGVFAALVVLVATSVSINGLVGRAEAFLLRWKTPSR